MATLSPDATLRPGFVDPVHNAQAAFRAVLGAMSRPGSVESIGATLEPPPGLDPATAAVLLALVDFETPLWLGPASGNTDLQSWLSFHSGVPLVADPVDAAFALILAPGDMPPLTSFNLGADEAPEVGATLIVQTESIAKPGGLRLTGPGIADAAHLDLRGVPPRLWTQRAALATRFPLGIDLVFTAGRRLAALPRTTRVEV